MDIQRLPVELLSMILNGAAPGARGAGAHLWRARPRRLRPFLDPRWRFAARGVCRLWREVIECPSSADTAHMGDYPHDDSDVLDATRSVGCPKWLAGRVVCASAVAEWIAGCRGAWSQSRLDEVYLWCRDGAGATPAQAVVALIASDVPEVVAYALRDEQLRLALPDAGAGRSAREPCPYDDDQVWRSDSCGVECDLAHGIASAVLARGSIATVDAVLSRDLHGWPGHLVRLIGRYGRADVARHLAIDAPRRADWVAAARSKEPVYFSYLIDALDRSPAEHRVMYAPPSPYCPFQWSNGCAGGCAEMAAAARGRWRFFAMCDARAIAFDARAAFGVAARHHRARLMDWLWRRDASGPRLLPPVLHDAALLAVRDHPHKKADVRAVDAIRWLCEVADYRPDHCRQLMALLDGTDVQQPRTVAAVLYLVERWPRMAMDSGAVLLRRLFCRCAVDGSAAASRLVRIMDVYPPRVAVADAWQEIDPVDLDLWGALTTMCTRCPGLGVAVTRAEAVLRVARVCRAVALHHPPRPIDVGGPQRPCACAVRPDWSYARRGMSESCARVTQECVVTPHIGPGVLAGLAPLARWCAPRQVRAADLFDPTCGYYDNWERIPPNTLAGRLARARTHVLAWLQSEGLLVDR